MEFKVDVEVNNVDLPHDIMERAALENNLNVFLEHLQKQLNTVIWNPLGTSITDVVPGAVTQALDALLAETPNVDGLIINLEELNKGTL